MVYNVTEDEKKPFNLSKILPSPPHTYSVYQYPDLFKNLMLF